MKQVYGKKSLGIDIGTTSISAVVWDADTHTQLASQTVPNDTAVAGQSWERMQDAEKILGKVRDIIEQVCTRWDDIGVIGLTGQMHGMLYVDKRCQALSPLVTWEDERGNLLIEKMQAELLSEESIGDIADKQTYAQYLSRKTGYPMSTGYGLTTYFYDVINHRVPKGAAKILTIMDYVAIQLQKVPGTDAENENKVPGTHRSNAASFGMYDLKSGAFDREKIAEAGMDPTFLPDVYHDERVIGTYQDRIPIVIAIGDNQAGVYAMLKNEQDVLLNIGTSSQISCINQARSADRTLECRPYVEGKYLSLYAGLCGGSSFAMLNDFLRGVCNMAGTEVSKEKMFALMMEAAKEEYRSTKSVEKMPGTIEFSENITVHTQFRGTREDPSLRGSISVIDMHNFTPGEVILGFYRGVLEELYEAYLKMPAAACSGRIILGGNAFRNNELLRRMAADLFDREVVWAEQKEEAARGSAMLAGSVALRN